MFLTYGKAQSADIPCIYDFCKQLIDQYEDIASIDYQKVLNWVHRKLEKQIDQYTVVYADGVKAGYYHFFRNEDDHLELDDLYVFPTFRSQGIGTKVIQKCLSEADEPVLLYVFVKNTGAVSLYQKLGFTIAETIGETRYIMLHA